MGPKSSGKRVSKESLQKSTTFNGREGEKRFKGGGGVVGNVNRFPHFESSSTRSEGGNEKKGAGRGG